MEANRNSNQHEVLTALKNIQDFSRKHLSRYNGTQVLEIIYGETASVLVRNFLYDPAEAFLNNGLELIPQSESLKSRLQTIKASKIDMKNYISKQTVRVVTPEYITPPSYNAGEVHASIKKHIVKCWNVDFFKKDGRTRETKVEQLMFIFYNDNKMKFKTGTEEHWGTWKLSSSGPTLILKSNEDQEQFSILVYESSPTQMRGIMSPNTSTNKKIEFNTCK
ncbi:MAG: hypothetical protein HC830_13220 [Bacteroidetes bacterium]|nr:hypothetical protein [Bacteroidales bacterium]NJO70103.1 hypothetical protein [Bacteroidota bacterium]